MRSSAEDLAQALPDQSAVQLSAERGEFVYGLHRLLPSTGSGWWASGGTSWASSPTSRSAAARYGRRCAASSPYSASCAATPATISASAP